MLRVFTLSALLFSACAAPRQYASSIDANLPFSSGVLVGDTFYVSGHLGLDKDTKQAPADPSVEAELLMDAFTATLAKVGMNMDNLVQVQVFCTDLKLYKTFNSAYRKRFNGAFPSRAFIGTATLLRGCRFEMVGIATR